jgi:hypothetical protein
MFVSSGITIEVTDAQCDRWSDLFCGDRQLSMSPIVWPLTLVSDGDNLDVRLQPINQCLRITRRQQVVATAMIAHGPALRSFDNRLDGGG